MKRVIIILLTVVGLTSCGVTFAGYNFEQVIANDKHLIESFMDYKISDVNLVEAQGDIQSSSLEKLCNIYRIVWMKTVFRAGGHTVVFVHQYKEYDKYPHVEVSRTPWNTESNIFITRNEDIEYVKEHINSPVLSLADLITYTENNDRFFNVTGSVILYSPFINSEIDDYWYYIFRNKKGEIIKVDAQTGKQYEDIKLVDDSDNYYL